VRIQTQSDHRFRLNADTDSEARRTPIPTESGRHFRRKTDGGLEGTRPDVKKGSNG